MWKFFSLSSGCCGYYYILYRLGFSRTKRKHQIGHRTEVLPHLQERANELGRRRGGVGDANNFSTYFHYYLLLHPGSSWCCLSICMPVTKKKVNSGQRKLNNAPQNGRPTIIIQGRKAQPCNGAWSGRLSLALVAMWCLCQEPNPVAFN